MNQNSTTPTWKPNATYKEVIDSVFVSDLTELSTHLMTEEVKVKIITESIFKVSFGFCERIRKVKLNSPLDIGTNKDILITVVDSSQLTPLGLFDFPKGSITASVTGGNFEDSYYDVSVDIFDDLIHEGVTCIDYDKLNFTYSNCVEDAIKSQFLLWYSCLPPWIQSLEENVCEEDVDLQKPLDNSVAYKAKIETWKMMTNQAFTAMKQCRPPCRKTVLNIKKVYTHGTDLMSYIVLMKTKPTTIYTATYSFGFFR